MEVRILTVLLLTTFTTPAFIPGSVTASGGPNYSPSCMTQRLYRAGVSHSKAIKYEQIMVAGELTEDQIVNTHVNVLRALLRSDLEESTAIHDCIAKTSNHCRLYDPCQNGGQCQLNNRKNSYVCICQTDFTGKFCDTPHPPPVGEFRDLQKNFREFKKANEERFNITEQRLEASEEKQKITDAELNIAKEKLRVAEGKLQFHGSGCNTRSLGYRYQSRHNARTEQETGAIANMRFTKKYPSTVLRLTYSANIRVNTGSYITGRWYFMIDGHECRTPSKIDVSIYNNNGDNDYNPSVLLGICEQTSAGPIGVGDHSITVNVGHIPGHKDGDAYSGWQSTSLMEVQEMCPQF